MGATLHRYATGFEASLVTWNIATYAISLSRVSVKLSICLCVLNCQTYYARFRMCDRKLRCTHRAVCNLYARIEQYVTININT